VENVNEMVLKMQYLDYSKKFRYEVADSALKVHRTRKEADQEGEQPLHRPKEWRKDTGTSGAETRRSSL